MKKEMTLDRVEAGDRAAYEFRSVPSEIDFCDDDARTDAVLSAIAELIAKPRRPRKGVAENGSEEKVL